MKKYFIEEVVNKIDEEVELYGWVGTVRDHKKIVFIDLRDRSGIVQVVCKELPGEVSPEDVVCIKGIVKKRPEKLINEKIKTGAMEIQAQSVQILGKSKTPP